MVRTVANGEEEAAAGGGGGGGGGGCDGEAKGHLPSQVNWP